MTALAPRIFVTNDPDAVVRAIANTAEHSYPPRADELRISLDGTTFHTALFNVFETGPGYYNGKIVLPTLAIDNQKIGFADGEMTYNGNRYILDETATIGELITKPIMRIVALVWAQATYYVVAQNRLTGESCDYFDGKRLTITNGTAARGDDLVEHAQYEGHEYIVRGNHMDVTRQVVTFDGQHATQLDPGSYEVTFADDLSTVTVTFEKYKK